MSVFGSRLRAPARKPLRHSSLVHGRRITLHVRDFVLTHDKPIVGGRTTVLSYHADRRRLRRKDDATKAEIANS